MAFEHVSMWSRWHNTASVSRSRGGTCPMPRTLRDRSAPAPAKDPRGHRDRSRRAHATHEYGENLERIVKVLSAPQPRTRLCFNDSPKSTLATLRRALARGALRPGGAVPPPPARCREFRTVSRGYASCLRFSRPLDPTRPQRLAGFEFSRGDADIDDPDLVSTEALARTASASFWLRFAHPTWKATT